MARVRYILPWRYFLDLLDALNSNTNSRLPFNGFFFKETSYLVPVNPKARKSATRTAVNLFISRKAIHEQDHQEGKPLAVVCLLWSLWINQHAIYNNVLLGAVSLHHYCTFCDI